MLSAGCDRCSRSAARVMFPSSATATQYRTSRSSGAAIGAAYGTPTDRSWTNARAASTLDA